MYLTSVSAQLKHLRLVAALALGICAGDVAWSKPAIQSIGVSPNPLMIGRSFTVTVAASPDVTYATAVMNTRKAQPELVQISLAKQGSNWVGSAMVPVDLTFDDPKKPEARVKVLVLDAALRRTEEIVRVPVTIADIRASFAEGILTITCDDQDNTVSVGPDAAGVILVNGGTVPIQGGSPTTNNTTLIRVFGMAGDDQIDIVQSSAMPPAHLFGGEGQDTLIGGFGPDQLDGGPGNDTLMGRFGTDVLLGGEGDDLLVGGQGADVALGGAGEDEFQWNPGDSNDTIEGQEDADTLNFFGSNVSEAVDISANGSRLRFFRNVANIVLDCAGVDNVVFHAFGGADQVVLNDLTSTDVTQVLFDLSALTGLEDTQPDTVTVLGTGTNDLIVVTGSTNGVNVLGLSAAVSIVGAEKNLDTLVVNAGAGDDEINASAVDMDAIALTLNGGFGIDTLVGSQGDDTFVWNPGDGLDVIEGELGFDTLLFNGSSASEVIDISANGERLLFSRNVAAITLDCLEVEKIEFNAAGGSDLITVNDLTGTGVSQVYLSLQAPIGSPTTDNAQDTVILYGTAYSDLVTIQGAAGAMQVMGLSAKVNIVGSEPGLDTLILRLLGQDDTATAEGLAADVISLIMDGGFGSDVLIGSAGADMLIGDEGDDILLGGPGLDVLDGGLGNNILIQD